MTVSIDPAGRLVIPKAIRDAVGITPGTPLEITVRDGIIEIEPPCARTRLSEVDGLVVVEYDDDTPELPAHVVDDVLGLLRAERGR